MNYLPKNLTFKDGVAQINDVSLLDVVEQYGTPLYVYDWEHVKDNITLFTKAFGKETLYRYAAKAFICKALVKELDEYGWGVDVVSGGEMATVQETVGSLEKATFNGTFKRLDEIEYFIQNNGGHISIDNRYEIGMLDEVATSLNKKQPVIMRINLDAVSYTHLTLPTIYSV